MKMLGGVWGGVADGFEVAKRHQRLNLVGLEIKRPSGLLDRETGRGLPQQQKKLALVVAHNFLGHSPGNLEICCVSAFGVANQGQNRITKMYIRGISRTVAKF